MNIGIISTHSFPIPFKIHTGDVVIMDLVKSLSEMGHHVNFYAPEGSYCPPNGNLLTMEASYGNAVPSSIHCELKCFEKHSDILRKEDIVHDFSVTKKMTQNLNIEGHKNTLCTLMGGPWTQDEQPHNLVAWTESHKERIIRGATDYENTPTPNLAGPPRTPVNNEVYVVNGGIDIDFYTPTYNKRDFYLWMGRWHPVRGYKQAIELAIKTKINLVLAGEHPDNEKFDYQRQCVLEAINLAKGHDNISFSWLPLDPDHHIIKRELYRQAKAFLYTVQFNEPFGLSQVESLACGTPVIATNYGSMPEVIVHGKTGIICNNSIDDFENALQLISNIDSAQCRSDAVNKFDRKVMANNYIKLYIKILGKISP